MSKFEEKAMRYAEEHGIIEYGVTGSVMEYLSFYGPEEGWVYVAVELDRDEPKEFIRKHAFDWLGWIPYWLKTESGSTRYNYMEG